MKICFYTVLCRPVGSRTWLPISDTDDIEPGNFFVNPNKAMAFIKRHAKVKHFLPGPKEWVGLQFKIASVVIANNLPDNPNPEHS